MTNPSSDKNGSEKRANDDSKNKTVQISDHNPDRRRMSAFLSILLVVVVGILFTIAVASWQKGNLWAGLWWGIGGFLLFGAGAAFAYYYYVIKPTQPVSIAPKERPYVLFRMMRLTAPLAAGSYPVVEFELENISTISEVAVEFRNISYQFTPDPDIKILEYRTWPGMRLSMPPTQKYIGKCDSEISS